ncbi:MAG: hypothetical protein Q4B60_09685 [Erysipelotrichaceae bacterium]|nr:hypothetical protein [Erysipelotrichaceae bacterium]
MMENIYIYLAVLFVAKVIDNGLSTTKTLLLQRNRWFLSGICVFASTFIYFYIAKVIVSATSNTELLIVSLASAVGCIIACLLSNVFSKDKTYINVIMSDDMKEMQMLRDFLAEKHITNTAFDSYTKDWRRATITITAYAKTRNESKSIDEYIESRDIKFKRIIQKA